MELNSFLEGRVDLGFPRRHLFPGTAVDDMDLFGFKTQGRSCGVDGHRAAAYHGHALPLHIGHLAHSHILQELGAVINPGQIFARDSQPAALMSSDGQNHRAEATLAEQSIHGDVLPQLLVEFDFNPCSLDVLNLLVEDVSRQAIFRNSDDHHPAGNGKFFKDGHRITSLGQSQRSGQPGRTGADDGHLLILRSF